MATDQDVGQNLTFALLNYTDVFRLREDNSLATVVGLDYEIQAVYSLAVKCTDDGGSPQFVSSLSRRIGKYDLLIPHCDILFALNQCEALDDLQNWNAFYFNFLRSRWNIKE